MNDEFDIAMTERRRRRRRAWLELAIGLSLIVGSILTTRYWLLGSQVGGLIWYVGCASTALVGFVVFITGLVRRLRVEKDGLAMRQKAHGSSAALTGGVGFKTIVAWRYLMARDHRISVPVLVIFLAFLFLFVMGSAVERTLVVLAPRLEPELVKGLKSGVNGLRVFGAVGVFGTLIVGVLRYVFSFFTTVPLVGVWIGTGALVCVLAVMSGFETDLREKILGSNAHIQVTREDGEITNWREVKAQIDRVPGVIASSPYAVSEVVIAANNGMPVIIKGIDPETVGKVTNLVDVLKDKEAIDRLEPIAEDDRDLTVPERPTLDGDVIDPPPDDMPGIGEPVDFSRPSDVDPDPPPPPLDEPVPPEDDSEPHAAPEDALDADGDAAPPKPVLDPPPDDFVATTEEPRDFSGKGGDDAPIHVLDVPLEPRMSRRTELLPGILVGQELAKQIHLYTGEEVRVVSPLSDPSNPDATGTPIPFNRDYRVAGIFYTGMYEYDLKYVYVTLESLTDFLDRGDVVDGIEIRIGNADATDAYVHRLQTLLGKEYRVQDWKELNRSLFSALKLEKIAMFLVLGIVILVASFSIVGNLIMVVVEKGREIALLKTLGASDRSIMLVFAIQGLLIGIVGTGLGVSTGLLACWFGKTYGIPLNPDVYYIDRLPVHVDPTSVVVTAAAGIVISIAATFYPAIVAARVRPAAGMRH